MYLSSLAEHLHLHLHVHVHLPLHLHPTPLPQSQSPPRRRPHLSLPSASDTPGKYYDLANYQPREGRGRAGPHPHSLDTGRLPASEMLHPKASLHRPPGPPQPQRGRHQCPTPCRWFAKRLSPGVWGRTTAGTTGRATGWVCTAAVDGEEGVLLSLTGC